MPLQQVTPQNIWFSKRNPDSLEAAEYDNIAEASWRNQQSPTKKSKKSPKKTNPVVKAEPVGHHHHFSASSSASLMVAGPSEPYRPASPAAGHYHYDASSSEEKTEVWFHESCLVWAPGICLIPPRLVGLDEV